MIDTNMNDLNDMLEEMNDKYSKKQADESNISDEDNFDINMYLDSESSNKKPTKMGHHYQHKSEAKID